MEKSVLKAAVGGAALAATLPEFKLEQEDTYSSRITDGIPKFMLKGPTAPGMGQSSRDRSFPKPVNRAKIAAGRKANVQRLIAASR